MKLQPGDRLISKVEKVVFGGPGLCRTPQGVVFVDFTAPEDEVEFEIVEVKKNYARGRLLKILAPSPDRADPRCRYFGACGGCDWQHLPMESQLSAKQEILRNLFSKSFGFANVQPIWPSGREYNYRNRIQVKMTPEGPSFRRKRSHDLLPIDRCEIAEESINLQLEKLSAQGSGRLELRSQDTPTDSFHFSQVNSGQNERMISWVLEKAQLSPFNSFFDLYCGSGNFSFPLSEGFPDVRGFGVELDGALVSRALEDCAKRRWGPQRLQFVCSSVDDALRRMEIEKESLILLDPPRAGCGEMVARLLGKIPARRLLYISCHPMTLARDLRFILESGLWSLREVQPVDMFPQTSHIEVLLRLERED